MRKELKRALSSPLFIMSTVVFFLCLQGFALPVFIQDSIREPLEYRQSALALSLGGFFFGGVILLLPFCAPMAHAVSQVDDLRSGMMHWCILRSSVGKYASNKILSCFLASALSMGGAFAVHVILWNLLAVPYDPIQYPNHEIGFYQESFFLSWSTIAHGFPIYAEIGLGLAFSAGIWSVAALAAAVWVPDKLLVVTIPACIFKLWGGNLAYYLFGIWLPSPDTLFNDAQTVSSVLAALAAYGVLLGICVAVYYAGLKRRACHA